MMYTEPSAGQCPQPHLLTRDTLRPRKGQLDNDVLSLAHGPLTDDRPPCRLQKLADLACAPCPPCPPCAPCAPCPPRYPLSDIHSGCWTRLGGECDSPVSRRQLRYGLRPGGIGRGFSPISIPSQSTCTFRMYHPDVQVPLRGASCVVPCTSPGPICSPFCHVSLMNLGRVGARKP